MIRRTSFSMLVCALMAGTAVGIEEDPTALHRAQQVAFRNAAVRAAATVVTIETIGGIQPIAAARTSTGPAEPLKPGTPRGIKPRNPGANFMVADGPTTGVIFSADGFILTSAFNFAHDPSLITVILPDGRRFVGELLARDEVRQLAMLKVDAADLPVPEWAQSPADLQVGGWAIALGRGFGGPECSISAGIVSGLNRQGGLAIQTDAKLSPANYGGPLVDLDGRIVGICVPMGMTAGELAGVELYDSGIGFAIPHWQAMKSVKELQVGHSLRRGLIGIAIDRRVPDMIRVFGIADPSPGNRAGMKAGDIVIAIDSQKVTTYPEMLRLMRSRLAGEKITVRVRRDRDEVDLRMTLAVPEDLGDIPQPEPPPPPTITTQPGEEEPAPPKPRKE